jgi:hypothetical protein
VDGLATAVRDADGNLKVIIWDVDDEGNVVRKGSASAGPISLVSVIPVSFGFFSDQGVLATAIRDGSGNLKVIIWDVDDEGNVVRKDSASAGPVGQISAAMLYDRGGSFANSGRFVTAVQDGDGNLKVIGWNIDKESLKVTRLGSATDGAVSFICCCPFPDQGIGFHYGFVTAVRDGSGNLKNIVWSMDSDGNLQRDGEGSAGNIGLVSAQGMGWRPNASPY